MTFGNTGGFTNVKLMNVRATSSVTIYNCPNNTIAQFNLFAIKPDSSGATATIAVFPYDATIPTNLSANAINIINRTVGMPSGFQLVQRSVSTWNYNLAGLFDSGRLTDFGYDPSGNLHSNGIVTLYPNEAVVVSNLVNGIWIYFGLTEFTVT